MIGDALAWPDVERLANLGCALLVVPLGATEQHGAHLPLSTDTDIAEALVAGLCRRCEQAVAAPAIALGASGEHAGFAGTLSIGRDVTERVLVELGRSAFESYARMVIVSTHGGNAEPVTRAIRRLRAEGRDARAWGPSWGGDAHAGRTETSLMMALAPERVRMERASQGAMEPVEALLGRLRESGVRSVSPNGVLGDPSGASTTEGRRLLAAAAEDLDRTLARWWPER